MKLSEIVLQHQDFSSIDEMMDFFIILEKYEAMLKFKFSNCHEMLKIPKKTVNVLTIKIDYPQEFSYIISLCYGKEFNECLSSTRLLPFINLVHGINIRVFVTVMVNYFLTRNHDESGICDATMCQLEREYWDFENNKIHLCEPVDSRLSVEQLLQVVVEYTHYLSA